MLLTKFDCWFDDEKYISMKYISLIVKKKKNKIDDLFARNKIISRPYLNKYLFQWNKYISHK